jgi:hypothetical protein
MSNIKISLGFNNRPVEEAEVRSYASEKNLMKALEGFGFTNERYLVVKTFDDRYTAIFSTERFHREGGYVGLFSQHGFMTFQ